jgi:hypothetical protein
MDHIRIVEIESWPQAAVAVTFILAVWVVPRVLDHLRDKQPSAKTGATRHEPVDTRTPQHKNANWITTILRKVRDASNRRIG